MTEPTTPAKAELVQALRDCRDEALTTLRSLPEDRFAQGRYENGWNGRQILAHVASIEWAYPRLLQTAAEASVAPAAAGAATPAPAAGGGIDAYNARQVEKRAGVSIAELTEEFARNRETLIAAVEKVDEALFAVPIESAGGVTGPLGQVLRAVAVDHVRQHVKDIAG
ncbi:MAG: DinB family protein [Tepidiformaceae bacterium]